MQVFLIMLVISIFLHDSFWHDAWTASPRLIFTVLIGPKLLLAIVQWLLCRLTVSRMSGPTVYKAIARADRLMLIFRAVTFILYVVDLSIGGLRYFRSTMGDLILIDELLIIMPTLLLLVWSWWSYYPIDRRVREARLIGMIDHGLPVYPIWSRSEYLISQIRHQIALIMVPLVLILAWAETVMWLGPGRMNLIQGAYLSLASMAGAMTVFLFAPLMIRMIWDTAPLPQGAIRERLTAMCRFHRIGVRELLLWRTYGGMINAAVMGLISPLRYIFLTDALLEMLPQNHVEAVMAHELAHIRKHHMFWLLLAAAGSLGVIYMVMDLVLRMAGDSHADIAGLFTQLNLDILNSPIVGVGFITGLVVLLWTGVFGWISRRIERQADTFAVLHMNSQMTDFAGRPVDRSHIQPESVYTMVGALGQVAELNHLPVNKHSWRHGSIKWRQDYLKELVGKPSGKLPIDRLLFRIKLFSVVAAVVTIAYEVILTTS